MQPDCGIRHVSCSNTLPLQSPKCQQMEKSARVVLFILAQKVEKSFSQWVKKLFGNIIKLPESLKVSTIYFGLCLFKSIDITTMFGHCRYQFVRCFTFTGSASCSKYTYSKGQTKYFWGNVTGKVWHCNC